MKRMRIGTTAKPFEMNTVLADTINEGGTGIIGLYHPDQLPDDIIEFIYTQYARFNIPIIDKKQMNEVIRLAAYSAYYHIDVVDPYTLLTYDMSNVSWSHITHSHAIEIKDSRDGTKLIADPEKLEVFELVAGQDEIFFNEYMAKPGLDALPRDLGDALKWTLFEFSDITDQLDNDVVIELQKLCMVDGEFKRKIFEAYFELACWAAFLWMVGPLGRTWRVNNHDVFWLCETEGMCVLYETTFMPKEYYTIHDRDPRACAVCGLDSYCVELIQDSDTTQYVCEKHLNGAPLFRGATCGSKVCKYVECHHHIHFGHADALNKVLKHSGQIVKLNHQNDNIQIESPAKRLIAN